MDRGQESRHADPNLVSAAIQAACDLALWVADYFHEFRALFEVLHQWERKAYGAIGKEEEAAEKLARAKSEATRAKRLQQYDSAQHTCEQAMARYEEANKLSPPENDDAILRWNTCARIITRNPEL